MIVMNKYEENVYKNLFEYPTKKIVELEQENEKLKKQKEYVLVGRMQLKTRDYIHQLEKEKRQLENNRDKAIEILGNYKHYSTPTEEQNKENEDIVDNAYNILKGDSDENNRFFN